MIGVLRRPGTLRPQRQPLSVMGVAALLWYDGGMSWEDVAWLAAVLIALVVLITVRE